MDDLRKGLYDYRVYVGITIKRSYGDTVCKDMLWGRRYDVDVGPVVKAEKVAGEGRDSGSMAVSCDALIVNKELLQPERYDVPWPEQ